MTRVALFGGSFNPPGLHHRAIAKRLAEQFDEVIVVPCGPRPDKAVTNDIPSVHRAALADLGLSGLPRVRVDLFDLESGVFSRTWELEERYRELGEVWHVVGADILAPQHDGLSTIKRDWARGNQLWESARFAVISRPGFSLPKDALPPRHEIFSLDEPGSSSLIREHVFNHRGIAGLVTPEVAAHIERHGLYRGIPPGRVGRATFEEIRPLFIVDGENPRAVERAAGFRSADAADPNLIVVVGGDGAMLRAIRREWRRRLPFFGVNAGHYGFLLNQSPPGEFAGSEMVLHHLPLLWVETESTTGERRSAVAFNDAWVERASGQTAWIEVKVNGTVRLPQLVADGVLAATPAGSTSYARAMGAAPMPLGTPALLLAGSNVLRPSSWRHAVLPSDAVIEFSTLDPVRRPLIGFIDGVQEGPVRNMKIRASRVSSVELLFDPSFDPAEKLARIQFPEEDSRR